jgi:peptidyl-prolyl cis-trans isomerase SurA
LRNLKISLIFLLILFFKTVSGQIEGDRVIAVIGNEIITESDFQYQVQLYARQNQISEINPMLVQQIFQSMLTNKVILAKAEQDSIIVTEDEVLKELDSRVKGLIAQVGSVERLEEVYGMNLPKIKNLIKDDLQKNIKIDRMRRKKFQGGIKITEQEVKAFYETYKDSLPDQSNEYEVAHIIMERKVSEPERNAAKNIALEILDSIKQGADFSELAIRNSGDSLSAIQGGDLGFAGKGTFVKEFEEVVFNLKEGEVSDIVETQFGYHIIKLNEKSGDRVRSQHILIKFPKFESSDFETITFLKDLKNNIVSGKITFDSAAKLYSEDLSNNEKGGYIGKIPEEQFDSLTVEIFKTLSPGDITDPIRVGNDEKYGYEIYKFIAFIPEHKLDYKDDYEKIKKFALSFKENSEMEKWVEEMRETVYVDIRM